MGELNPRLRAVCDLSVAEVREYSGRHEYDGTVQDLSPAGVQAGLTALAAAEAAGGPPGDVHDEQQLAVFERAMRVTFDDLELHRVNPLWHLANLDLACYDRPYAAAQQRDRARAAHLAAWPQAIDGAIGALDRVPGPVARAMLSTVSGLAAGIPALASADSRAAALGAHARLVRHLEQAAQDGPPDPELGEPALTALMGATEGMTVDIGRLSEQADAERDRLSGRLADSCGRIDARRPALDVARELVRDHPDADGVLAAARRWTARAIEFTRDNNLVPYTDGECLVRIAPESRRWAMAMLSPAAPGEPDGPSWYYITPPDPSWPEHEAQEGLEVFSDTTLPGITVHEVAPGHFSHFRAVRHAAGDVRRTLQSAAFVEGWAHYAEELCVEEGFCAGDPRFEIGVWLEALVRVTRLAVAIGVHAAGLTVQEGAARFAADTHLAGQAALSEAQRATFDPTYGRYTWGKLEIMRLRDQARRQWGAGFSLRRFHSAMLDLGSPALGLLDGVLQSG